MADNENVTIRIRVRADTSQIDRVQRKLAALCAQADACEKRFNALGNRIDDMGKSMKDLDKQSQSTTNRMKDLAKAQDDVNKRTRDNDKATSRARKAQDLFSRGSKKLGDILGKTLRLALKAVLIETLAYAAALSSVNLLLKTGSLLNRAWTATVRGVGVAAANAAAGIAALAATFAAAMRQMAAAQASGGYGGNFTAASRALRSVQGDAQLAVFGVESLTGAFAAASRNARVTGSTVAGLRGLTDFAVASGDMEKGLLAAANVISLLQKGEAAGGENLLSAAKELGPQFEKAYKDAISGGKKTNAELIQLLASGQLAQDAGIAGTAANVQGTLIGQLKTFATEMQLIFGDLGQSFIGPIQTAFNAVRKILYRTIFQITGNLNAFANGPFIDFVVGAADKIGNLTAKLFNEYLPMTQEVLGNFIDGWRRFTDFFSRTTGRFKAWLENFSDAGATLNRFFGEILGAIGGGISKGFDNFADLILRNEDNLMEFGRALGDLIGDIFELFRTMRAAFFEALPALTAITNAIGALVSNISSLISALMALGPAGAAVGLFGLPMMLPGGRGSKMRGKMGGFGKAAPIATLGFLATGALAGRQAKNVGTGAAIGTGIAGGAVTGAAAGAMFGPAGAAIGAIGGAIVGGLVGWFKSNEFKEKVKDGAISFAQGYANTISEQLIKTGHLDDARKAMGQFGRHINEVASTITEGDVFARASIAEWGDEYNRLEKEIYRYETRLKDLSKATGRSEDDILQLAQSLEIDLSDPLLNLQDVLAETGLAVGRFGDEFNATINNALGQAIADAVIAPLEIIEGEQAINAATQNIRELAQAGTLTTEDQLRFAQTVAQQANLVGGGDPLRAIDYLIGNVIEGTQFGPGGSLAGLQTTLMNGAFGEAIRGVISGSRTGIEEQILSNIIADASAAGFSVNTGQVAQQLSRMSDVDLLATASGARVGGFLSAQTGSGNFTGRTDKELVEAGLSAIGITASAEKFISENQQFLNDLEESIMDPMEKFTSDIEEMKNLLVTELGGAINRLNGILTKYDLTSGDRAYDPNYVAEAGYELYGQMYQDDSRTPRRSLVDTMAAHRRFNSMIPGSRSVTSSLRGYNLGSMGSDHAAGRAYDLVGQNLGLYRSAVLASGGYAEFHGGPSSGRHLHVVPGSTPMGDTATPYMGGATMMSAVQGGSTNINVQVYGTPGMDEEALANAVVRKIESQQRSMAERR
jgi:hypothetical protein